MKKYLMGALSIVLAVSLYSFAPKQPDTEKTAPLYWFRVDASGNVTQALGNVERSTVINTNCPDAGSTVCARGYSSNPNLQAGDPAPVPSTSDIKRN